MPPPTQPGGLGAAAATAAASVTDRLFGTRTVTSGASRQLPRKTPLRIEPKTFFGEMGGETSGDRHGVCVGGGGAGGTRNMARGKDANDAPCGAGGT